MSVGNWIALIGAVAVLIYQFSHCWSRKGSEP
jgi:hypothetical protein